MGELLSNTIKSEGEVHTPCVDINMPTSDKPWNNTKDGLSESDKFVTPQMPGLASTGDQYRDIHNQSFDSVKKALAFLVAQNAQLRVDGDLTEEEPLSNGFHTRLQGILTNEICDTFAEHMRGIQRQTGSSPLTGVEGSPQLGNIPKAPRAMLISERVRVLEDMLRMQDQTKALNGPEPQNTAPPKLELRTLFPAAPIPIPSPSTLSTASILDNNNANPINPIPTIPPAAEIAIPLDPQFLSAFKNQEREEGEISSPSVTPARKKRSSVDSMRGSRAVNESDRSRRSASPAPLPKHRLPSSRTYRFSRSPEATRRRLSPSRKSSRSSRRSPSYSRRTKSPERRHYIRSSSPRTDRRYRRAPPSPTPRSSRPLEPTPRERSKEYDSSRVEPLRANTLPDLDNGNGTYTTRRPRRPDHERNVSAETTSSDYRRSNHDRRNREEGKFDADSSRPLPNKSMSSTSRETSHGGEDIVMKERTPTLSHSAQEQGSMERPEPGSPVQITKMSCHNIPGLWMVTSGLETVEILSCQFEIDKIIAEKWGVRRSSRHGKEKEHDSLSLKLACVPLRDIEAVQTNLGRSVAKPEDVADAVGRLETLWPPSGHLVIEINPDRDWGKSWLPRHLGEDQGAIEIIDHVHEGTNFIRFIQLAGLSNFTFLVVAREKPPDYYCLESESTVALNEEEEAEDCRTDVQLLKDFVTSIQITYS